MYREFTPHPALGRFVACCWHSRSTGLPDPILPDCCSDIILRRAPSGQSEVSFVGLSTKPFLVVPESGQEYFGLRFRSFGAAALLGPVVHELLDSSVPFAELGVLRGLMPDAELPGPEFLAQLERLLLGRSENAWIDTRIVHLAGALGGAERVGDMARVLGVSRQFLGRLFRDAVGVPLKQYSTIARVHAMVSALRRTAGEPDWGQFALEHGFFDQSHFISTFRGVTGTSPRKFWVAARAK